ncbi:MAG: methyl-accepting chemotaxis protein [Rhodocyclaceae bacterium]|jgi:hypothetical protein|nr:methyl-accepting chemotaxis protein [Rhodocyclaceae bacterium]
MKGVMEFLEKAGLVKQEVPSAAPEATMRPAASAAPGPGAPAAPMPAEPMPSAAPVADGADTLNLADIYAQAGVPAALYPAERLLRLVDGLSAMDEATRLLAIKAMDAADESWTIADPLQDASLKVQALAAHGAQLRQELERFEAETQARVTAVRTRQEQRVGEIRKQMSELEALLARELTRGEQECAEQDANLAAAREQVTRELGEIARHSTALQGLTARFGTLAAPPSAQE